MKTLPTLCIVFSSVNAHAATTQTASCQVTFPQESVVVDSSLLDRCVESLQIRAGSRLVVSGYASEDGSKQLNKKLSVGRAQSVAEALKAKFEGLDVRVEGLGELDKTSRYVVVENLSKVETPVKEAMADVPGTKVASLDTAEPVVTKQESLPLVSRKSWRAAVRVGSDNTRVEAKDQYLATGLDLAYLPQVNPYLRLELGVLGSLYSKDDENELTSYHFAPMVGYQNKGFVAGVRGLAGVVESNDSDKTYNDAGAELRLGLEGDMWSFFVGGGRTENLERVGLDLGVKF